MDKEYFVYEGEYAATKVNDIVRNFRTYFDTTESVEFTNGNAKFITLVAEKYYFRINSTLSATASIFICDNTVKIGVIVTGGKEGLLGISWGAEDSAFNKIYRILIELGFKRK